MSNTQRVFAIIKRPSEDIARAIVDSMAGEMAALIRRGQISRAESDELTMLREEARRYRASMAKATKEREVL